MKIISNKLYEEYTKEVIGYHQNPVYITKEQLYDVFKFHCAGVRVYEETVEYIYNLIQKDKTTKTLLKPSEPPQDIDIEKVLDEIRAKEKREFKRKEERKERK